MSQNAQNTLHFTFFGVFLDSARLSNLQAAPPTRYYHGQYQA